MNLLKGGNIMAITDIYFNSFVQDTKAGNIWTGFINTTDFIINENTAITRVIFSNEDGASIDGEGIGAYSTQNAIAVLVPQDILNGKYDVAVALVNTSNPEEQFICSTPSFDINIEEEITEETLQIISVRFLKNVQLPFLWNN